MRTVYKWNPETEKMEEIYRSGDPGTLSHLVITDEIGPTLNHADGKVYTSRKAYAAASEAAGCQDVSVSELLSRSNSKREVDIEGVMRDRLEKTYYDLRDNRIPRYQQSEETRQILRRIEEG